MLIKLTPYRRRCRSRRNWCCLRKSGDRNKTRKRVSAFVVDKQMEFFARFPFGRKDQLRQVVRARLSTLKVDRCRTRTTNRRACPYTKRSESETRNLSDRCSQIGREKLSSGRSWDRDLRCFRVEVSSIDRDDCHKVSGLEGSQFRIPYLRSRLEIQVGSWNQHIVINCL